MEQCPISLECSRVAQKVFSIPHLRYGQLEATVAAVENKDSIIVLPTGGGKSRCFQMVPFVRQGLNLPGGLVVVIQPLVALLKNQVDGLNKIGLKAALDAKIEQRDAAVHKKAVNGEIDFCKTTTTTTTTTTLNQPLSRF